MVAVAMKMPMPSMAALPLMISAFSEKMSPPPTPSYAFITLPFRASGKYPWGFATGTSEAAAMPDTTMATSRGYLLAGGYSVGRGGTWYRESGWLVLVRAVMTVAGSKLGGRQKTVNAVKHRAQANSAWLVSMRSEAGT
jgi:hypothetical protein